MYTLHNSVCYIVSDINEIHKLIDDKSLLYCGDLLVSSYDVTIKVHSKVCRFTCSDFYSLSLLVSSLSLMDFEMTRLSKSICKAINDTMKGG